jgi:lambda family phage minor tail protein L
MTSRKTENINRELFGNDPNLLIEFYTIYDIPNTSDTINFHGGVSEVNKNIIFNGNVYKYLPFEAEGFDLKTSGSLARPSLKLINLKGFFSGYIKDKEDLLGAKVKRERTFLRFLDKDNFINYDKDIDYWKSLGINPDPTSKLEDQNWIINRKSSENKIFIEYELISPLDLENLKVPRRQVINNYCFWKYRGESCGYSGPPVADANDALFTSVLNDRGQWQESTAYAKGDFVYVEVAEGGKLRKVFYICVSSNNSDSENRPTVSTEFWAADECSKKLKGCKFRFKGDDGEHLPFGGFPGSRIF